MSRIAEKSMSMSWHFLTIVWKTLPKGTHRIGMPLLREETKNDHPFSEVFFKYSDYDQTEQMIQSLLAEGVTT
jgi:hypothetical protein